MNNFMAISSALINAIVLFSMSLDSGESGSEYEFKYELIGPAIYFPLTSYNVLIFNNCMNRFNNIFSNK